MSGTDRRCLALLLAAAALIGCGAQGEAGATEGQPASSRPTVTRPKPAGVDRPDGKTLSIVFADGGRVSLRGFRTAGAEMSGARCGVMIAGRRVLTMGVDDTEVYTCNGLAGAGAVPSAGGVRRVGLIYDVSSPNARFRTAVVLRADGGWHVDPAFAGRFDDVAAGRSLPALRRALR